MRGKDGGRVGSLGHCAPNVIFFIFPSRFPSGRLPDSRAIIFMKLMSSPPPPTQPPGSSALFIKLVLSSLSLLLTLFFSSSLHLSLCLSLALYGTISGTENMIFTIHLPAFLPESPTFPSGKLPGLHVFDMAFHPNFRKHKPS